MITKVWLDLTETLSDKLYTPTKLNMELASRLKAAEWCTICPFSYNDSLTRLTASFSTT